MTRFDRRSLLHLAVPLAAAFALGITESPAYAELSKKVIAAFKGKVVVTHGPLEGGQDDKETIARIKKDGLTQVVGRTNDKNASEWEFNYTAFLKSAGNASAKMSFYHGSKFVAEKSIPSEVTASVLEGKLTVSEADGLVKGKSYTLKVVSTIKGKEVVFASSAPLELR